MRILVAGDGGIAKDLKYLAFDLGVGNQVMFLHQDPEPFFNDLLSASDLIFEPQVIKGDFQPDIPGHLVEAMACGVVPLVVSGSVAAEMASGHGVTYMDGSAEAIGGALQQLLVDPTGVAKRWMPIQAHVHKTFDHTYQNHLIAETVERLLQGYSKKGPRVGDLLSDASKLVDLGKERDALVLLEECKLIGLTNNADRARWHLVRGEAYYGIGDMESATGEFSDCMRLDDRNHDCLRGLGFVSWKGHSNEEAMIFFKKALALKQDDRRSQYGIGMVYRRLGLLEESLFWLEQSMIGPQSPDSAVIAYSQTCIQMNRPEKAAKRIEQAMDTVGEHPTLLMTLGQLYLTLGRIPEAKELMGRAANPSRAS